MSISPDGPWGLNPNITYLNHGSFGACPTPVLRKQRELIDQLERDPIQFLAPERELLPKIDAVRNCLATEFHADPQDLVFVRNTTEGVNAVLRSFPFDESDRILITSHGYNACNNAARFVVGSEASGTGMQQKPGRVDVAQVPFPISSSQQVIDAIEAEIRRETRLLVVDHVTSPTGLVFPIKAIAEIARDRGIRVLVDGAHAPGMLPLDLERLGVDYYTGNHHKWLCAPKASAFLCVRRELQGQVRPTVISHGVNSPDMGRSQFHREFNWTGTFDPTPLLCVGEALDFLSELDPLGLQGVMNANHRLAMEASDVIFAALQQEPPAPESMIGSLVSVPLDRKAIQGEDDVRRLKRQLFDEDQIELPVFLFGGELPMLRVSAAPYNSLKDFQKLADRLSSLRREGRL